MCVCVCLSLYPPTYLPICKYSIIYQFQCICMNLYCNRWAIIPYLLYFDASGCPLKLSLACVFFTLSLHSLKKCTFWDNKIFQTHLVCFALQPWNQSFLQGSFSLYQETVLRLQDLGARCACHNWVSLCLSALPADKARVEKTHTYMHLCVYIQMTYAHT